jgi:beta-glucosidase
MATENTHHDARGTFSFWNPELPMEDRINRLISQLTIDEKIACLGTNPSVPRLVIKGADHVEGLHGLAMGEPAGWGGDNSVPTTTFPQAIGMAETWNPDLLRQAAAIEGYETRWLFQTEQYQRGGLVVRAPNADLGRDIRWGRTEECYGEDPFFNGTMAAAFTRGLQGDHPRYWQTASLLKHFLANSNEDERLNSSSDFDQRLWREYYSIPFRMAIVEGGSCAFMAAYNAYNQIPCTVHPMLRDTAVKEWGQDGIICTDGGALTFLVTEHHFYDTLDWASAACIKAGISQFLDDHTAAVHSALAQGVLSEEEIDGVLKSVFRVMMRLGLFDPPEMVPYSNIKDGEEPWKRQEHIDAVRLMTQKSIVLLKNSANMLPLDKHALKSVAVIGPRANEVLLDWYSGSPPYAVTPLDGIKAKVGSGVAVWHAPDNSRDHAVNLARVADVAIVCVGNHPTGNAGWAQCPTPSDGKESVDRRVISLEQEELIRQVYRANPNTVVVLISSFPFAINWTQRHVPAILRMTHNSQELGNALADALFGDINPGGRLVQTWPRSIEHLPPRLDYDIRKGRTYMYFNHEPLYPFGFGLSYTTFAHSNLQFSTDRLAGDGEITVSMDVQNTGDRAGDEVVQLYAKHLHSAVERPKKALKGFKRITLQPQETQTVQIPLRGADLAYWDADTQNFIVEEGRVQIQIGQSSADITLTGEISVSGCCLGTQYPFGSKHQDFGIIGALLPQLHTPKGESPVYRTWNVPNGNYRLTLTLGDENEDASTAVSVEPRRLMLDSVDTAAGQLETRIITVNVRNRELQLCCTGAKPRLKSVEIEPVNNAITVYLAGDSTVCDQVNDYYAGWGQMLGRFFTPDVAVSNHAESGRATKSFIREKRLDVIRETVKAGDYLFIQFGHNDQKPEKEWYVEAFTTYKEALRIYTGVARQCDATPVLITSTVRRFFDDSGTIVHSHGDYPDAVRQLAAEEQVFLVDLYALSKSFFEELGPEESKRAFVQYPAGTLPGQKWDIHDNTHFSEYGAYELARCVAQAIRESDLGLAQYVVNDLSGQNAELSAQNLIAPNS